MKKSEMMKKQAEKAYVIESIISRVESDLKYSLYEPETDENGEYVMNEDGETIYTLPESQRDEVTWEYNYLTKGEREDVYMMVIEYLEKLLDKM